MKQFNKKTAVSLIVLFSFLTSLVGFEDISKTASAATQRIMQGWGSSPYISPDLEKPDPATVYKFKPPMGEMTVHFIDVGQGDSTLLQGPKGEFNVLIDAGDNGRKDVVPYLKSVGVTDLDLVIGTHPHSDHIGQMAEVIEAFDVKEVWLNGDEHTSATFERAIDAIINEGAEYHEPRAGETDQVGSLKIEVVHPYEVTGDYNNDSIGVRISYGETSILFTGDAETEAEKEILARGHDLQADIFQMGHHGSSTSNAINPKLAIYSAGVDNSYGHPHETIVTRMKKLNIPVIGTDVNGDIKVLTNGLTYRVIAEKSGQVVGGDSTSVSEPSSCININTATKEQLMMIKHIGSSRADQLISLRPFSSLDEMTKISGISVTRLNEIKAEGLACAQ